MHPSPVWWWDNDKRGMRGGRCETTELDAIDEEVLDPTKILAAKFEDEIVPPPLEL
jgi:hypothetical protein